MQVAGGRACGLRQGAAYAGSKREPCTRDLLLEVALRGCDRELHNKAAASCELWYLFGWGGGGLGALPLFSFGGRTSFGSLRF